VVPPVPKTTAIASQVLSHAAAVVLTVSTVNGVGSLIVMLSLFVHPVLSVTVMITSPAQRESATTPVSPLLHTMLYGVLPPAGEIVALPSQLPSHNASELSVKVIAISTG
jgi:hypothetical protein